MLNERILKWTEKCIITWEKSHIRVIGHEYVPFCDVSQMIKKSVWETWHWSHHTMVTWESLCDELKVTYFIIFVTVTVATICDTNWFCYWCIVLEYLIKTFKIFWTLILRKKNWIFQFIFLCFTYMNFKWPLKIYHMIHTKLKNKTSSILANYFWIKPVNSIKRLLTCI